MLCPLADGGDGTVESAKLSIGGNLHSLQVRGADGKSVTAQWLEFGSDGKDDEKQALVELANSCGIGYLDAQDLQPLSASTFGLGEVIADCYRRGIRHIKVGVGGSASTDGGMGALTALGVQFFAKDGTTVPPAGGGALHQIHTCSLTELILHNCTIEILTDVRNPLLGEDGAAKVFSPQKGADQNTVKLLDSALSHFADVLERASGRDCRDIAGTGAAGGAAFGLACALGATIGSGFDWIAETSRLNDKIERSSLVITGEGKFDSQSLNGKVIGSLARRCLERGRPLWVVAGAAEPLPGGNGVDKLIVPLTNGHFCTEQDIKNAVARSF